MNGTTAACWRIRRWTEVFEKSDARKVKRALRWVSVPVHHDSCGFRYLTARANGAALYGAWIALVGVAAKCPIRGTLASADRPLTTADLQVRTGFPAALFDELLAAVSDPIIGWVESVPWPIILEHPDTTGETGRPPDASGDAGLHDITGPDRTDSTPQDKTRPDSAPGRGVQSGDGAGPVRIGPAPDRSAKVVRFRNLFVARIEEALGLGHSEALLQRSAFLRMAERFEKREDRDEVLDRCVEAARDKRGAGLRNPAAAFQAEVDRLYPKGGQTMKAAV